MAFAFVWSKNQSMKGVVAVLMLASAMLGLTAAEKSGPGPFTYYVQLIRGCDRDESPQPGSKRVGPRLAQTFHSVFRLRSYWEVGQREVAVSRGRAARVRLNKEREVEIDLRNPDQRRVTAFQNGEPVERIVRPLGEAMTIMGGNRDSRSVWFIVVRRDKP